MSIDRKDPTSNKPPANVLELHPRAPDLDDFLGVEFPTSRQILGPISEGQFIVCDCAPAGGVAS